MNENVFFCEDCEVITVADADSLDCEACEHTLKPIGYMETAAPKRGGTESE